MTMMFQICVEDTVRRIMERYSLYNSETDKYYTVVYLNKTLDMNLNLVQNGVTLNFNDKVKTFVPTLMLQYRYNFCLEDLIRCDKCSTNNFTNKIK